MPEIGAMLRETRMRKRIDIADVESATKIRAKYLRALENEEWDLLPGPTFVKTFLRTYAEYLEVDPKPLVEEYKQRFDRPGPQDLLPFSASRGGAGRRQRRSPILPPAAIVGLCVLVLVGVLWLLGSLGDPAPDEPAAPDTTPTPTASEPATGQRQTTQRRRRRTGAATATRVRLQILPEGLVNVCLVDAAGRRVIDSDDLDVGDTTRTYRSKRFRVAFGNGAVRMRVDGRTVTVPDRPEPIGFDIRPGRLPRELVASARPTCGRT